MHFSDQLIHKLPFGFWRRPKSILKVPIVLLSVLRYADGVLPGQGSPDQGGDDDDSEPVGVKDEAR